MVLHRTRRQGSVSTLVDVLIICDLLIAQRRVRQPRSVTRTVATCTWRWACWPCSSGERRSADNQSRHSVLCCRIPNLYQWQKVAQQVMGQLELGQFGP